MAAQSQTTYCSYQGTLNTNGTPANGNYDFRFRLTDGSQYHRRAAHQFTRRGYQRVVHRVPRFRRGRF